MGPSALSGLGSQQGENSGRFLEVGDEIRRSAGHEVTRGQGCLFCSGYNYSSQGTEKPQTRRPRMHRCTGNVALCTFWWLSSVLAFKHFPARVFLNRCEMTLSASGSRLDFPSSHTEVLGTWSGRNRSPIQTLESLFFFF